MADMIDYPTPTESPFGGQFYTFESGGLELHIPIDIRRSLDSIVDEVHASAKRMASGHDETAVIHGLRTRLTRRGIPEDTLQFFDATATTLSRLIREKKDSIHAFIFKNIYRPATFKQFDVICGNPPWVVYKSIRDGKRAARLKDEVVNKLELQTSAKLFPGMELATLFYVKCAKDMLKPNGHIGFVMPWTILNAKQHDKFRARKFKCLNLRFVELYDMGEGKHQVRNLFTVESCVLFAKKTKSKASTIPAVRLSGSLSGKSVGLDEADKVLEQKTSKIYLRDTPDGNVLTYDKNTRYGESPYKDHFFQGATLVPAAAWFIREKSVNSLGTGSGKISIETDDTLQLKAKWNVRFSGDVETDYIFNTIKAGSIIPFGYIDMKKVVLPIMANSTTYDILDDQDAFIAHGHDGMSEYYMEVQKVWEKNKTIKSPDNVSAWVDYRHKITDQKSGKNIIVLYNQSGREYMVSCVIYMDKFIVDNSTYAYYAASEDEAKYLCTILNSKHLFSVIKSIKTARAIHRTVFDLPIPKFDCKNVDHKRLVGLYDECRAVIRINHSEILGKGKKREFCLGLLDAEMAVIDEIVKRLLMG